jgi:hypothetical protein
VLVSEKLSLQPSVWNATFFIGIANLRKILL